VGRLSYVSTGSARPPGVGFATANASERANVVEGVGGTWEACTAGLGVYRSSPGLDRDQRLRHQRHLHEEKDVTAVVSVTFGVD
jgi:hypothetical protein